MNVHSKLCRPLAVTVGLIVASSAFGLTPARLRTETKVNPLGVGQLHPMLSWIDTAEPGQRNQSQSAYRVVVSVAAAERSGVAVQAWDSGKVMSDNTAVECKPKLESNHAYVWTVQVWDQDGKPSATSEPASFESGLLSPTDWKASWIADAAAPLTASKTFDAPQYLRKPITVDKPVRKARLYATAMGLYDASIDGKKIGDTLLAPDWTDYRKRVRYQCYDVTAALGTGQHVLGATLADGWYAGHLPWVGYRFYGGRPNFYAQLVVDYTDGTTQIIDTDSTWKTHPGPATQSDLYDGEDYDARNELPGWNTTTFDDSKWTPAAVDRHDGVELDAQVGPPVRELMQLPAKTLTEPAPGKYTFDLGQNMVGFVRFIGSAPAGTKVTLRFAEMLNPDGTVYTKNMRGARALDTYIFKGAGVETFRPQFTFHGFRYVEVSGLPAKPDLTAIRGIVIGSATPHTGEWVSSSDMLNKLQSNITWGQRGNYLSVPTDCPQRDERLGWMGDAQVYVRTASFNADVQSFFDSWMVDVEDAQKRDGAFTVVSPAVLQDSGTAAWADAGVICPWTIYQVYGDTRILTDHYAAMSKYIDYLISHSDGLIRPDAGYGDWLSINADTPKDLLGTAYFAYSAKLMSNIATALHKTDDAEKYSKLYNDVRAAFRRKWVKPGGDVVGHTQTSYLLALKFDLLDESERAAAVDKLVADVHAKGDHLSTGFVGVSYLLPTLSRFGQTAVAYTLLNQDTFPSWLFSVKHGATTIWERWDGWTPDKGFQDASMNSFNHYSLGSCGEWMYDTAAGLGMDRSVAGFKKIVFRPTPGGGLTSASAKYDSVNGPVACGWTTDAAGLNVKLTVPPNTTATLYLPAGDVTESGRPMAGDDGVHEQPKGSPNERAFDLGSGEYRFDVRK